MLNRLDLQRLCAVASCIGSMVGRAPSAAQRASATVVCRRLLPVAQPLGLGRRPGCTVGARSDGAAIVKDVKADLNKALAKMSKERSGGARTALRGEVTWRGAQLRARSGALGRARAGMGSR